MGAGRQACLAAAAALLLVGCQATPAPTVIDESRADSSAPDAFRNRTALPPCPDVVLDQGKKLGAEALECLERGYTENGAELAVARPTVEGDMVVRYARVTTHAPALQLFHDSTRDKFGSGEWTEASCPLPQGQDSIAACLGIE
ncbi:hypothetical protein AHIS1636_15550 [Arthrobacter mangrovi]|uniref:Lipoprotein n=1 Tax=Arthrobacter mangrovi TaxID=2966350 RepID=A0ABQ5MSZ4_9MICC|nr:hypothetical protein AHIS1636_15550 [Arthrobacter mangrovi]